MVEKTQDQNNRTTEVAPVVGNAVVGRDHLLQALNAGPKAIVWQVRYVLMLSQVLGKTSPLADTAQKPLNIHQARLQTLVQLAESLSSEHLNHVTTEIQQLRNQGQRLSLLLDIAPKVGQVLETVCEAWEQVETIANPVAAAQILFQIAPLLPAIHELEDKPTILAQVVEIVAHLKNVDARVKGLMALRPLLPEAVFEMHVKAVFEELKQAREMDDELSSKVLRAVAEHLPPSLEDAALGLVDDIGSASYRAHALTALAAHLPVDAHRNLHEKALDSIEIIEDEDERAEALIAFAMHLESAEEAQEYPKLLEKALLIAITISSHQMRAQLLVALAPHLTEDLQREALAAVQGMKDEGEQAQMLSQLIPTLPSEMQLSCLDMADKMTQQEYRAQVLSVLAQYVPQQVRQQTMMDALYAASNLPNLYERVRALINLQEWLPQILRGEVLNRAVNTIVEMDKESAQARALNLLAEHLASPLFEEALNMARAIRKPQLCLNALLGFLPQLDSNQRATIVEEMLDCVQRIRLPYKRAQALIGLAAYLSAEQLREALMIVEGITKALDQINVYVCLAEQLPFEQRAPLLDKALIRLKRITDAYERASAMVVMMPYLEEDVRVKLRMEVYQMIERTGDAYDKANTIALLAPLLEGETLESGSQFPDVLTAIEKGFERALQVPWQATRADLLQTGALLWVQFSDVEASYGLWKFIAPRLISLPLADVLLCLEAIRPILQQIAGKDYSKAVAYILGIR